ncbi:MAG: thiosulfate oxidation carrier complex protein SoxZ [Nevskiaceae bacterium]|nr:MAG: thiosulfate oxidation carrier complex protein SoxZ [Nevskiaceae bacterium]TBR73038.1 MAG: thiosulfate oxidation carrier complex protein SoxZ [Nevskiaceae bacterium]
MAEELKNTIRVLAKAGANGEVDVKALVHHPMDSGLLKDASGKLIPAHYIKTITFKYGGKVVFVAQWSRAVSKDPFIGFRFDGGAKGGKIDVSWQDNEGMSDATTAEIR